MEHGAGSGKLVRRLCRPVAPAKGQHTGNHGSAGYSRSQHTQKAAAGSPFGNFTVFDLSRHGYKQLPKTNLERRKMLSAAPCGVNRRCSPAQDDCKVRYIRSS